MNTLCLQNIPKVGTISCMDRKVDTEKLVNWIKDHNPSGVVKLAVKAKVSDSIIQKTRLGYVPKKPDTRRRICAAMGMNEDELFPLASDQAS